MVDWLMNEENSIRSYPAIEYPGITGFNFLRSLTNPPLVVFTTAYPEYALELMNLM